MRTVSLAALIIAAGVLAALPFRLSPRPSKRDVASGPVQTVLDQTVVHAPRLRPAATKQIPDRQFSNQQSTIDQGDLIEIRARARTAATRSPTIAVTPPPLDRPVRPTADAPLTFDDLMIPIDAPQPIADRYEATADTGGIGGIGGIGRVAAATIDPPPIQPTEESSQTFEPLPQVAAPPKPPPRVKHWIVQPE